MVKLLVSSKPLILRRLLLVLFAGPVLIAAAAGHLLGYRGYSIQRLCWSFDNAWDDRPELPHPSSSG